MKVYRKKKSLYSSKDAVLPRNYKELYFDTIKQNWRTIFVIGIMSLLFFAPCIAFLFWKDFYFMQLSTNTSYTPEEIDALRITANNYLNIGVAFGIAFASIGVSGLSRINLLISREEGFFFFKDLNKGIRQNFKTNFVFFLIYAVLIYFSLLVINNTNGGFISYLPFGIVHAIAFPLLMINVETTSIYSWKLKDSFRNAFIILVKNFLVTYLFATLFTASLALIFVEYIYLKYIIIALLIIIVYPFLILAMRVYFNRAFDKDINKDHYPEIYKKGIYEDQDDDFLKNVIMKYYNEHSTFGSIMRDPLLDTYFNHLCAYAVNDSFNPETEIAKQLDVWPNRDSINNLNYLRGLVHKHMVDYIERDGCSVLHLKQTEKKKVAIICAGGGYYNVCTLPEGFPICVRLHKEGMAVFSFNYPIRENAIKALDALKAFIHYLLRNQDRMNIDMEDYMVMGFSAGGHLVGELGTDNLGIDVKPKLLGLCYPVISMSKNCELGSKRNLLGENPSEEEMEKRSIELHVGNDYPNVFLWQCERDNVVPFENSLLLEAALKEKNIDYRFEHFDSDVHGFGIATNTVAEGWLDHLIEYYKTLTKL